MMPTRPGAAFKMIEPQLFFHLLVVLLHPPAPPGRGYQSPQAHIFRQITQIVFDRPRLVCWPLHQEPNLLPRCFAMVPVMGALYPLRPETRGQPAVAALPPGHRPKPLPVSEGQFLDRDRLLAAEAHTFPGTAPSGPVRNGAAG